MIFSRFDDLGVLARTLWGEARGEGRDGMEAVACVVLNRIKSGLTWWGSDVRTVCLCPWQFSCWNQRDPNRPLLEAVTEADAAFAVALDVARRAMAGDLPDRVNGATHYYDRRLPEPPYWAVGREPLATVGHHVFFMA